MSITTILPPPGLINRPAGKDTLLRLHLCCGDGSVSEGPVMLEGVSSMKINPWGPAREYAVFRPDTVLPAKVGYDYTCSGELEMLETCAAELVQAILDRDWTSAEPAALPQLEEYPAGVLEIIWRDRDKQSHIMTQVLPGICFKNHGVHINKKSGHIVLPFVSQSMPFYLSPGVEIVVDRFQGDGVTRNFTLSGLPVRLLSATDGLPAYWFNPFLASVTQKQPGQKDANPIIDGLVQTARSLAFSTAPAENCLLTVVYASQIV